jgi:hypothetical protein
MNYVLEAANCKPGTLQLTLLADSVTDLAGNSGPEAAVSSYLTRIGQTQEYVEPAILVETSSVVLPTGSPLVPTQPQTSSSTPKWKSKSKDEEAQISAESFAVPAISSESWIAISIALLAVFLARRSGGRPAIRR